MSGPRRCGYSERLEAIAVCAASACWKRGIPRPDYPVLDQREEQVGTVTSGTHSPVLGEGIGLAYLQHGVQKIGTQVYIDMKGKRQPAVVVKLPFLPSVPKKD